MATKKGILSDANYMANCEEYKPLPIGFANAHFLGNRPNPNLMGVKTPKYQRAAIRPVSADVMAVNMARGQGNSFGMAREYLDMYIKEGKEFKPPPVKLKSLEENLEELHSFLFSDKFEGNVSDAFGYTSLKEFIKDYYGLVNTPVPKIILQNRGDAILKQTISTAVNTDDLPDRYYYLARFNQVQRPVKEQIYTRMLRQLQHEGVSTSLYLLGPQPNVADLESNMNRLLEVVYSRGVVADLDNIFQLPTMSNLPATTQIARMASGSSDMGASTQASLAPTQQGVALPSTSSTTQEVEKK
jgi:hypothetical protein